MLKINFEKNMFWGKYGVLKSIKLYIEDTPLLCSMLFPFLTVLVYMVAVHLTWWQQEYSDFH